MKAAVIVVDMLIDNLKTGMHAGIEKQGMAIVPVLKGFLARSRERGFPVIYANDSFLAGDALFGGALKAHAIRGTEGAEVIPEIAPNREISSFRNEGSPHFTRPTWIRRCAPWAWIPSRWPGLPPPSAS